MISQIAKELLVPDVSIEIQKVEDSLVYFTVNKVPYYAKVTKTGKIKKGSTRRDFA